VNHPDLDYSTPVTFTLRQRISLSISSTLVALVIRIICLSCRLEVRNAQYHHDTEKDHGCIVLVFWHEVLPLAMWYYRNTNYHTLTSYSRDGELITRIIGKLGIRALRGSSSRGGREALVRMEKAIQHGVTVAITPDGPRGPRRELKAGTAVLAVRGNAPVVPVAFAITRCWRMKSWDKMVIPKPFSTIVCEYADPIWPSGAKDMDQIAAMRLKINTALNAVQERAEASLGVEAHDAMSRV
jgi:lysophospholipid acyltransferase (LPLAT)-like uncharacterized protein